MLLADLREWVWEAFLASVLGDTDELVEPLIEMKGAGYVLDFNDKGEMIGEDEGVHLEGIVACSESNVMEDTE